MLKYYTLNKLGVTFKQCGFQIIIRLEFAFVGKCLWVYPIVYDEFKVTNFVNNFYLIYCLYCFINIITFAQWIYWNCSNLLPNDILTTLGWLWWTRAKRLSPYIIGWCIIAIGHKKYKIMYLNILLDKSIMRIKKPKQNQNNYKTNEMFSF